MTRVCMRPGCDRPAAARLSYNTVTCQVWLDLMPTRLGPVQEICDFHAEHLTVPRGWMLCDRRIEEPALFVPTVAGGAATSTRSSTPAKRTGRSIRVPAAAEEPGDVGRLAAPAVSPSQRPPRHPHPTELTQALFTDGAGDDADGTTDAVARVESAADPAADPVEVEPAEVESGRARVEQELVRVEPGDGGSPDGNSVDGDDPDDDLPESLRAKSPLLSRAFRATGPQKSVLTHSFTGDDADSDADSSS